MHFYEPAKGHGLPHDPFNAIVGPRPIGWISSVAADGTVNLAPYSFFNAFNYRPPIIGFASVNEKDSLANARATGEFVWNLATRAQAEAMSATSAMAGAEVDEFALAGLTKLPSTLVAPPRVAGSPVHMECRVSQIVRLTAADGTPAPSWMVFGEVVGVHIDEALLDEGVYRTGRARPIMRGGGTADYFEVSEANLFRMARPG